MEWIELLKGLKQINGWSFTIVSLLVVLDRIPSVIKKWIEVYKEIKTLKKDDTTNS